MAKKGMSVELKRTTMLAILQESEEKIFVLKDLEKQGSARGVVLQTVKDVVSSLISDEMASCEKIGSVNIYWSLPSQRAHKLKATHDGLTSQLEAKARDKAAAAERLAKATAGRQDTADRAALQERLAAAQATAAQLRAECERFSDADPAVLDDLRAGTATARDAANRWTDNIHALYQYCSSKFEGAEGDVRAAFKEQAGIDIDTLEHMA